ncbi:hypothetical protein Drorol1_Dr00012727 [Drosera rotundifolia]
MDFQESRSSASVWRKLYFLVSKCQAQAQAWTEGSDDGNVGSDGPDGVGMDLNVEINNIDVDQEIEALCSGNVCDNIGSPNQDVFATFEEDLEEDEDDDEDGDYERATADLF